jgi:hypothetical protein
MDFYHYDPRDYLVDGNAVSPSAGPMPCGSNRTAQTQAAAADASADSSLSICIMGMVLVRFTILVRT